MAHEEVREEIQAEERQEETEIGILRAEVAIIKDYLKMLDSLDGRMKRYKKSKSWTEIDGATYYIGGMLQYLGELMRMDEREISTLKGGNVHSWNLEKKIKGRHDEFRDKIASRLFKEQKNIEHLEKKQLVLAEKVLEACHALMSSLSSLLSICKSAHIDKGIGSADPLKRFKEVEHETKTLLKYFKNDYRTAVATLKEEKRTEKLAA